MVHTPGQEPYEAPMNACVKDRVGLGRSASQWFTLNCKYNAAFDIHRLNVGAQFAEEAVSKVDDAHARVRFQFIQDAPDLAAFCLALRTELQLRIVVPTIVAHSDAYPFLVMGRFECGKNGNPHWHCIAAGDPSPEIHRVRSDAAKNFEGDELPASDVDCEENEENEEDEGAVATKGGPAADGSAMGTGDDGRLFLTEAEMIWIAMRESAADPSNLRAQERADLAAAVLASLGTSDFPGHVRWPQGEVVELECEVVPGSGFCFYDACARQLRLPNCRVLALAALIAVACEEGEFRAAIGSCEEEAVLRRKAVEAVPCYQAVGTEHLGVAVCYVLDKLEGVLEDVVLDGRRYADDV